jgi:2-aminoadipate transaminase
MLGALEREMHGLAVTWTRPQGGLFVWMVLPSGADSEAILTRAVAEGVAFIPGPYFYPDECAGEDGSPQQMVAPRHTLRLNFSYPAATDIPRGVKALASVLRDVL